MGNPLLTLLTAITVPDGTALVTASDPAASAVGNDAPPAKSAFAALLDKADKASPLTFMAPKIVAAATGKEGDALTDLAARIAAAMKKQQDEAGNNATPSVVPGLLPNAATARFAALAAVVAARAAGAPAAAPVTGPALPLLPVIPEAGDALAALPPSGPELPALPVAEPAPAVPKLPGRPVTAELPVTSPATLTQQTQGMDVASAAATEAAAATIALHAAKQPVQPVLSDLLKAAQPPVKATNAVAMKEPAQAEAETAAAAAPLPTTPAATMIPAAAMPVAPMATALPTAPVKPAAAPTSIADLATQASEKTVITAQNTADQAAAAQSSGKQAHAQPVHPADGFAEKLAAAKADAALQNPESQDIASLGDATSQVAHQPVAAKHEAPITTVQLVHARLAPGQSAADAVGVQIRTAMAGGLDKIRVQLHPEDLGRVDVSISVDGSKSAQVVIAVDKPETLSMLVRDHAALTQALADAGIKADAGSLQFELRDQGTRGQAQTGDDSRHQPRGQGQNQENDGSRRAARDDLDLADNGMFRLVSTTGINIRV